MPVPEPLLHLAGFAFAHAIWNLSDLQEGELLTPLAIVEEAGLRKLLRFEAETQEEAIALGKAKLYKSAHTIDAWAFAREGQIDNGQGYIDVLTVEASSRGLPEPILFLQKFQPNSTGQFKLLKATQVFRDGKIPPNDRADYYLAGLRAGIESHTQAAALWSQWDIAA